MKDWQREIARLDYRPWHPEDYEKYHTLLIKVTGGDEGKIKEVFRKIRELEDDKTSHTFMRHTFLDFFMEVCYDQQREGI